MPDDKEHYTHQRLFEYWNSLKGDKDFPDESQIDTNDITDIWQSCFLISIDDVTRRLGYRYSYLGKDLMEAFSGDSGNPDIAHLLSTADITPMVKFFDRVCKNRKPEVDAAEFTNLRNLRIKYRLSLFLWETAKGKYRIL